MRLIFTFVVLLVSACTSLGPATGPYFSPLISNESDTAILYVYRPYADFNREGSPELFINGENKGLLRSGGYMGFILPPGVYEIKAEGSTWGTNWWPGPSARALEIEVDQEYYVRVLPVLPPNVEAGAHLFASNNVSRTKITLVPKGEAQIEIAGTKLSP